jgi:YbbR domain-containing protein
MKDFFRRNILHNLGLKLLSLAMAVSLWLAVTRDPVAEVAVEVPIEFHHFPENLEISSENIPQAQIRVRGPERVVHRLRPSDIHAEIDLSGARAGERTFDLSAHQIRAPHDLEIEQVVPSQLRLGFDTRMTRELEVHPRVIGNFAAGYSIGRVIADPPHIAVIGPKTRVEAAEAAITDPVDVSGTMDRGTFVTKAYVSDPLIQVVHPEPIRVTVIMEKNASHGR